MILPRALVACGSSNIPPTEIQAAADYARAEKAAATKRAYSKDFKLFRGWCAERSVSAFRRSELVALDVADIAETSEGLRVTSNQGFELQGGGGLLR
jgi:hypothetical protein